MAIDDVLEAKAANTINKIQRDAMEASKLTELTKSELAKDIQQEREAPTQVDTIDLVATKPPNVTRHVWGMLPENLREIVAVDSDQHDTLEQKTKMANVMHFLDKGGAKLLSDTKEIVNTRLERREKRDAERNEQATEEKKAQAARAGGLVRQAKANITAAQHPAAGDRVHVSNFNRLTPESLKEILNVFNCENMELPQLLGAFQNMLGPRMGQFKIQGAIIRGNDPDSDLLYFVRLRRIPLAIKIEYFRGGRQGRTRCLIEKAELALDFDLSTGMYVLPATYC